VSPRAGLDAVRREKFPLFPLQGMKSRHPSCSLVTILTTKLRNLIKEAGMHYCIFKRNKENVSGIQSNHGLLTSWYWVANYKKSKKT
jgi:hypothetical protein